MERTNTTSTIASEISHRVGLDSAHTASPAPSVDDPRGDCHESHEFVIGPSARWLECDHCAVRDYYPGAAQACPSAPAGGAGRPAPTWTRIQALNALVLDLYAFSAWWRDRIPDFGDTRASMDEWTFEFLEWRTGRKRPKPKP